MYEMRKETMIKHYTQTENGGRDAIERDVGGIPKMRELEKVVSQSPNAQRASSHQLLQTEQLLIMQ